MPSRSTVAAALIAALSVTTLGPWASRQTPIIETAASTTTEAPLTSASLPDFAACGLRRAAAYRHGCRLLEEFLGVPLDSGAPISGYSLDILIATLPDPVDSRMDWGYDLYLESLRRAFETADFVTDRYWLPSPKDTAHQASELPDCVGECPPVTDSTVDYPAREVYPGVILFRHKNPAQRSLRLLYIVGEVPTGGIYKRAFHNALVEREGLVEHLGSAADTLRIVGPVFSGSAASLAFELRRWLQDRPRARISIITGAATNETSWLTLDSLATEPGTSGSPPAARVTFRSTINSDATLEAVLRSEVLPRMGINAREVALLRESSTQYGRGIDNPGNDESFLVIPFPMNISSLRTEYARNPEPVYEGGPDPVAPDRPRIPLSLLDTVRPRETPPVHSNLTAAATDLVLEEISRALRSHNIRAVGLLATDVRDKLFLGEFIRRRIPDVQLFTFESNALYLRRDYNNALHGMIALSSYPLVLDHQWWAPRTDALAEERLVFPSDGAQGIYNATLMQLGQDSLVVEYGTVESGALEGDSDLLLPPVWVSAVGTRSFLPLRAVYETSPSRLVRGIPRSNAPGAREIDDPIPISFLGWGAWILLGFAIAVVSISISWVRYREGQWPDRAERIEPVVEGLRSREPLPERGTLYRKLFTVSLNVHREVYTALLLAALAGLFLPAGVLIWKSADLFWGQDSSPTARFLGFGAIAFGIIAWLWVFLTTIVRGSVLAWRHRRLTRSYLLRRGPLLEWLLWAIEVLARVGIVLIGAFYLVLSLVHAISLLGGEGPGSLGFRLYLLRAMQLDSGLSPIPPLFLTGAGLAVWSTWHLQRIGLLARKSTPFEEMCLQRAASARDAASSDDHAAAGHPEAEVRVVEEISHRLFLLIPRPDAAVLAVCLCFLIFWPIWQFGRSFEGLLPGSAWLPFVLLFKFGIIASLFTTAWAVYRMLAVWRALERFLAVMDASDLRTAFERLPRQIADLTRLSVLDMPARSTVRAAEETHWRQLRRIVEEAKPEDDLGPHAKELGEVSREGDGVFAQGRYRRGGSEEFYARAGALEAVYRQVRRLWAEEPTRADIRKVVLQLYTGDEGDAMPREDEEVRWSTSSRLRRVYTGPLGLWLRVAEELVAVSVVDYVEWVMRHLRRLAFFLMLSIVLTTGLLSCYPFQAQSVMKVVFFGMVGTAIASMVWVMNQMSRNGLLSRVSNTVPGRIEWDRDYVFKLLLFVGVPLLAVISAEVPQVREAVFAWVEPFLRIITKS